jgi:SAM-dependent methyltransferase
MHETSKAVMRRIHDNRFATRYFIGHGIDIGAGDDPLVQYTEFFPLMHSCRSWDIKDGDAQFLVEISDESLDFAHSSHCLEHMVDPRKALCNWLRVVKPGGHLVVTVPDEDIYEQGIFPSTFNQDHKWTFTIYKATSWSSKSLNLIDLLVAFSTQAQIIKLEQLDATYRFNSSRYDQTLTPVGECALEFILRKLPATELIRRGRYPDALLSTPFYEKTPIKWLKYILSKKAINHND